MNNDEQQTGRAALGRALHDAASQLRQYGRLACARLFGTIASDDGRYKAIVDLAERSYFVRAECSALARLLIEKGVVTEDEWTATCVEEYRALVAAVGRTWPEVEVHPDRYEVTDLAAHAARSKRERWPR